MSNSEYGAGRLTVLWRKPFDLLAESITAANETTGGFAEETAGRLLWCTLVEVLRTFSVDSDPETRVQMQ